MNSRSHGFALADELRFDSPADPAAPRLTATKPGGLKLGDPNAADSNLGDPTSLGVGPRPAKEMAAAAGLLRPSQGFATGVRPWLWETTPSLEGCDGVRLDPVAKDPTAEDPEGCGTKGASSIISVNGRALCLPSC
jgi:hypothetical protein